jgi:hypothetical protein
MAPPVPTARVLPTARKPDDGHKCLITFALNPAIEFWEKSVTPPGLEGGDAIETTTQHNNTVHTKGPRKLINVTDASATVTWNPVLYNSIKALINKVTTVTILFPDLATLAAYGFLRNFAPGAETEGNNPEATITVTFTNQDPVTTTEELPVYTPPPVGGAPMAPLPAAAPWGSPPPANIPMDKPSEPTDSPDPNAADQESLPSFPQEGQQATQTAETHATARGS